MKDKEKQITEMAKDLNSSMAIMTTESFSDCLDIAKFLVGLDYRKIDNSVVLSREEWKQIKNSLYYSKEELERKLQKERKETAENILKWLVGDNHLFNKTHEVGLKKPITSYFVVNDEIEEIAKKYGVEVNND